MSDTGNQESTNILPWPRERTAQAVLAARGDQLMSQLELFRSYVLDRPVILLGVAAGLGFLLGRMIGR